MKYVILDNIRSIHNVGAIFRTADGAGVTKLYLCGTTPTPIDRFGRTVAAMQKTSLGAVTMVPWEYRDDARTVVDELQTSGVTVVAIEQTSVSVPLKTVLPVFPVAYVFGNEVEGVSDRVLQVADTVAHIPMRGTKESLNVSVCAGVVLFHHDE